MVSKERADQIAGGVFLIGLGLLFTNVLDFWPGILFVIGASNIARGMAEGRPWYNVSGGLWLIGLGLVFLLNFSFPVILILIGLSMLVGYSVKDQVKGKRFVLVDGFDKPKNEDKLKNDEILYEDDQPRRGEI
ncbi:MAG: hypothetical protein HZC41_16655 [Chloroflexi bacterium]|nr:hypothetical protein [Chloroflexota bacterium]